ncbi:MAG: Ig-like domain-containing protein [Candidatus Limnocylindrales bacterium]
MDLPKRLGWIKSGRFIRLLSASIALVVLAALLYNAAFVDRLPPTYTIRVSTTAGGGLAMTLTSIDVSFSEEVKQETAEDAFSIDPKVSGTFHWQGLKMIFTPSAKLPLSTTFHVHMAAGVQDLDGNSQGGTGDIDFTTVGAPTVVSVSPAPGAESVGVGSSIQVTFDRLMDTQKVLAGLSLKPDTTYQASWNGDVLTLSPTKPLQYGTTYTVSIGDPAVDTDGTKLPPYAASFRTVDVGLKVTSLVPAPNVAGVSIYSQIAVTFDAPIDPSSIAGAFTITPPVAGSTSSVSLPDDSSPSVSPSASPASPGANVLVFTPDNPLAAHTTYSVTMSSAVTRTDGQVASAQTWSFTTGEPQASALNQIAFISDRSGVDNVWLMNPDGSNQREVTCELVPVSGYDISGDGATIAYAAGGVVKKMSLNGNDLTTLTSGGNFEYAPTITPDGTGLVVARRDSSGTDLGYWLYPLVSGAGSGQLAPDGAPGPGSATLASDDLTGGPGMPAWAPRAAFTSDGKTMLIVRGADNYVELVDMTGANKPQTLSLQGNSRPVWVASDGAFYLAASNDDGLTWACWRVTPAGAATQVGPASSDIASNGSGLVAVVGAGGGAYHLTYWALGSSSGAAITHDPSFSEMAPSFSPDGSVVVFGRVQAQRPTASAGIWVVNIDGTGLTNLSTDGAYARWVP